MSVNTMVAIFIIFTKTS